MRVSLESSAPPLGEASNLSECQSVLLRCRVYKWHFCDVARPPIDFHFSWKSGRAADITAMTDFDPNVWSGRALQEDFFGLADVRSCINVSGL
jgi:hypothetical protein